MPDPVKHVPLTVPLPEHIVAAAEIAERESPGFLARVLHYGIMRRSIYLHLVAQKAEKPAEGVRA